MSITVDRIESSGFRDGGVGGVACASIYEALPPANGERKEEQEEEQQQENWCSSASTSSIGRNSDLSGRSSDGEDNEVQSAYNGPLDMMDSLEEVLPIRGISKFYNGKSKSFTSLADASSATSIKDIGKQENAYSRRRRNLLAISHIWDKNRSSPFRSNACGISKKPIISSRSTLALAVAMSSSESISSASDESNSRSPPPLPPLYPKSRDSPWRSYSVADLRQCNTEVVSNAHHSLASDKSAHDKLT